MEKIDLAEFPHCVEVNTNGIANVYFESTPNLIRDNEEEVYFDVVDGTHYVLELKTGELIKIFNSEWANLQIQKTN